MSKPGSPGIVTEPDGRSARIVDLSFHTMEPDEWAGVIGDIRLVLDDLEKGKDGYGDSLTPERALFLVECLAQDAAAMLALAVDLDGKIPSLKL